jgi:hypothetical protein
MKQGGDADLMEIEAIGLPFVERRYSQIALGKTTCRSLTSSRQRCREGQRCAAAALGLEQSGSGG